MRTNYPQIQAWVGLSEGGYVNHPRDPGGATDRGITQRTFDAWNRKQGKPKRAVRGISKHVAEQIIEFQYLDAVRAADLPAGLDYAMADYAVNSGPGRAAKDLQRTLGVAADGVIGVQTLAAGAKADNADLIQRLCQRRMRFLRGLKHWNTFKGGWTRRVMGDQPGVQIRDIGVIDRAVQLARDASAIPAPVAVTPGKALEPLPTNSQPTDPEPTVQISTKGKPMNDVKSFLASKTIWGAVIAVAPTVLGMLGLNVTGADAAEAAQHVNAIITAAGGLLVVYGRVKATKAIGK
ncbi:hypothetical protein KL867_02895 [Ruegeria litorea]|nr:glycosyl hydrolase 108 family protein [Falsiruegeria litorea]MBT3139987.1 hypothetical protein [Falsiruegeria litorea]